MLIAPFIGSQSPYYPAKKVRFGNPLCFKGNPTEENPDDVLDDLDHVLATVWFHDTDKPYTGLDVLHQVNNALNKQNFLFKLFSKGASPEEISLSGEKVIFFDTPMMQCLRALNRLGAIAANGDEIQLFLKGQLRYHLTPKGKAILSKAP